MSACDCAIHSSSADHLPPWRAAGSHGTDPTDDRDTTAAARTLHNARNTLNAGSNVAVGPPVNGDLSSELSDPPTVPELVESAAAGAEANGEGSSERYRFPWVGGTREYLYSVL